MKKLLQSIAYLLLATSLFSIAWVSTTEAQTFSIISEQEADIADREVSREEVYSFFSDLTLEYIPSSYQYISLFYTDVDNWDEIYDDLQRLVYIDLIENGKKRVYLKKNFNAFVFYTFAADLMVVNIKQLSSQSLTTLQKRNTQQKDIDRIQAIFDSRTSTNWKVSSESVSPLDFKREVFNNVYDTLINKHYNKDKLDEEKLLNKAIEWLAEGTDDKHTVYFPPVQSKWFTDTLNGEYEWIGAYVDMKRPWIVEIVSPIVGSPSEKAWLKGGDIITDVDTQVITENNSLGEVISWIKGPANTTVVLTILRNGVSKDITVTRAKITLKDIEYSKIDSSTAYVQMKSFWTKSAWEFSVIIKEIEADRNTRKIIFDLRNNGGGYLGQVSRILSHFIDEWEPVAVVKYLNKNDVLSSKWYDTLDLNRYRVVILQNSGTASASEIMIGTLKDYFPNVQVIWEKSYGKGSVQTTKQYKDGSLLKYTIARWYTGKSETWIDWIWIEPDTLLELDDQRFVEEQYDNQLEAAKKIR